MAGPMMPPIPPPSQSLVEQAFAELNAQIARGVHALEVIAWRDFRGASLSEAAEAVLKMIDNGDLVIKHPGMFR